MVTSGDGPSPSEATGQGQARPPSCLFRRGCLGWGWGCLGYFRKVMFLLECEADTAD